MIPGITGAHAMVGPPLAQIADRVYIGGVLNNTPRNMVEWIQHPRLIDPKTAMPDLGIKEQDARDIASYLYTLR
jgi:cytochrome c1